MLGQLSGQNQANSSLDLAGGHSGLLVVACQLGSLCGNLLEDVVDEGVQDGHSLGADASVRVNLRMNMSMRPTSGAFGEIYDNLNVRCYAMHQGCAMYRCSFQENGGRCQQKFEL